MTTLLDAPPLVQLHVLAAVLALLLGPVALGSRRPGGRTHVAAGRAWVAAMAALALSSFGITGFRVLGPFGPIHLLSLWVLWGLWRGVAHARAGRIEAHRGQMRGLYLQGLVLAGLLTLLPGRSMSATLFGEHDALGWLFVPAGIGAIVWDEVRRRRARARTAIREKRASLSPGPSLGTRHAGDAVVAELVDAQR